MEVQGGENGEEKREEADGKGEGEGSEDKDGKICQEKVKKNDKELPHTHTSKVLVPIIRQAKKIQWDRQWLCEM